MYFILIAITTIHFDFNTAVLSMEACRQGRSNHFRQDGGLCFEIPPWQHQPVQLEDHLNKLKATFENNTHNRRQGSFPLVNSQLSRYMDTVLAPFLDTYHRNIQNSYQQLTGKVLRRIKDEINAAVRRKQEIFKDLIKLADDLKVPQMCNEERRAAPTLASKHVADMYSCTEEARSSIAKMGNYAEEMIKITRKHMQETVEETARSLENDKDGDSNHSLSVKEPQKLLAQKTFIVGSNESAELKVEGMNTLPPTTWEMSIYNRRQCGDVEACLQVLSKAAVKLGYELDLSLSNARRHNEQSCTNMMSCSSRVNQDTNDSVAALKEQLYECVYA